MAKAPPAKQEEPVVEAAPPKPKSKLLLLIVVGLVIVLALGGGGAYFLLKKKHVYYGDEEDVASAHAKPEAKPTFVKLEAFTVKLMPDEGKEEQQFMQTVPEFKVLDPKVAENVKAYMPEIRHNILLLLSSRKPSELSTPQGMEKLSVDIRNVTNLILDGPAPKSSKADKEPKGDKPGPDDSVQAVLFSTFIIQ